MWTLSRRSAGAPDRAHPSRGARARRGFTLVEAMVAIVMLATGVLALVSSSAVVLNQMNIGSQQVVAAGAASRRLERLRSFDSCGLITAGNATYRGMQESWTVDPVLGSGGQPSRTVTYVLAYQRGRAFHTDTIVTNIPCDQ